MRAVRVTINSGVYDDGRDELEAVSEALWHERHLLGRLVFKLAIVRALLTARAYTWLPMAADEAAGLVDELDRLEGDPATLRSLRALAATAPAPWDTIIGEHCQALTGLRRQVRLMASGTVRDLTEGTELVAARVACAETEDDETSSSVLQLAWSGLRRVALRVGVSWDPDEMN
jgi:hypothetical protein